jgi:hypothetical protein
MAKNVNITMQQGATFEKTFIAKNSLGEVMVLTRYIVEARMSPVQYSDVGKVEIGAVITTPASGVITISYSKELTVLLKPNSRYFINVLVTNIDTGVSFYVLEGIAFIEGKVLPNAS